VSWVNSVLRQFFTDGPKKKKKKKKKNMGEYMGVKEKMKWEGEFTLRSDP